MKRILTMPTILFLMIAGILTVAGAPAQAREGPAAADTPAAKPALAPLTTVTIPGRRIPASDWFIPPLTRGDGEFNGHGPDVRATAQITGLNADKLGVQLHMRAVETITDFTTAEGYSPNYLIYKAPSGQCVKSMSRGSVDQLQYRDTDITEDVFSGQFVGSFVSQWHVVGDTAGVEAGTKTGAYIYTRAFTVNVQAC